MKVQISMNALNAAQQTIICLSTLACLVLCAWQIVNENLEIGQFVTVNVYLSQAFQPLSFLGTI